MPDTASEWSIATPANDAEWAAYFTCRWELLRAPWGQPRGSERDALEHTARHLAARSTRGETIAVGRVHLAEPVTAQIRYLAVADAWRRRGVGTALLDGLEDDARLFDVDRVIAQVRESAIPFYQARGYRAGAPGETLFGSISHIWMEKSLARNTASVRD